MKSVLVVSLLLLCVFPMSANAGESALKAEFLEACEASPHIDEGSNCLCVFNEVIHQFGEEDAKELIPFVSGDQEMETDISASLAFIGGKCEN